MKKDIIKIARELTQSVIDNYNQDDKYWYCTGKFSPLCLSDCGKYCPFSDLDYKVARCKHKKWTL